MDSEALVAEASKTMGDLDKSMQGMKDADGAAFDEGRLPSAHAESLETGRDIVQFSIDYSRERISRRKQVLLLFQTVFLSHTSGCAKQMRRQASPRSHRMACSCNLTLKPS